MTITLINTFVVPLEREDEFVATWRHTIDHFANANGFLDTKLHRNTGLKDTAYTYVNIAHWESVEAYRAVFDDFVPAGQRFTDVVAHPGLFTIVAEISRPAPGPSATAALNQNRQL